MKEGNWLQRLSFNQKLGTKFNEKSIIVYFRVACEFYRINHISG